MNKKRKLTIIAILACAVWFIAGFLVCNATTWKHYYREGFVSGYTTLSDTIQSVVREKIIRDSSLVKITWEQVDHDTFSLILGKKMIEEELTKH